MTAAVLPHRYAMTPVGEIRPHPENPNRGDVDAIADSIEGIGFYGVVVVHEATGNILIGSHRWAAAQTTGLAELPSIVVDCDEDTARRIMLGDNEYAKLARWDVEALVALLTNLRATDAELGATGFTDDRLAELVAQLNPAPPDHFPGYDDDLPTEHRCPRCGYEWSGSARPGVS
jgi:ParB-like chromosome segregation protein Spo0J